VVLRFALLPLQLSPVLREIPWEEVLRPLEHLQTLRNAPCTCSGAGSAVKKLLELGATWYGVIWLASESLATVPVNLNVFAHNVCFHFHPGPKKHFRLDRQSGSLASFMVRRGESGRACLFFRREIRRNSCLGSGNI
jgi:hypothetical protein